MSEFIPITTQEEFDAAIKKRIERLKNSHAEETAALRQRVDELEAAAAGTSDAEERYTAEITSRDARIAELSTALTDSQSAYMRLRVAHDMGLPPELANRLNGNSLDELRRDANNLISLVNQSDYAKRPAAPLASTEPATVDAQEAELRGLVHNLTEYAY